MGTTQRVGDGVGELRLDDLGCDAEPFGDHGAGSRPKSVRRHVVVAVAHAPQRAAHGVLAHAPFAGEQRGEDETAMPGQGAQIGEDRQCLRRQRHDMRRAVRLVGLGALHHPAGHGQHGRVNVDPCPLHVPQLARPKQEQRRQRQRRAGDGMAFVGHHVAQQGAGLGRVDDCCVVARLDRPQRFAQVGRRVALAMPRGNAVPEHLPTGVLDSVRGLDRAAGLNAPKAGQQLGGVNLADRPPA